MADAHWERRPDALWASIDDRDGDEFIAAMGELDDAVRAFLALALTSVGRKREAVSIALTAPAAHFPRYNRSLASYARELA
jgi:Tetratrico peptide repeat